MKAQYIKTVRGFTGVAKLYKISKRRLVDGKRYSHIIASAISTLQMHGYGSQCYLFPANSKGDVISWRELPGSMNGTFDHEEVMRNAGYEIVESLS